MGGVIPSSMPRAVKDAIDRHWVDGLFELAHALEVATSDCPESDVHEWMRHRIYWHLYPET